MDEKENCTMVGRKKLCGKIRNNPDFHRAYNSRSAFSACYQTKRSNQPASAGDTAGKLLAVVAFGLL